MFEQINLDSLSSVPEITELAKETISKIVDGSITADMFSISVGGKEVSRAELVTQPDVMEDIAPDLIPVFMGGFEKIPVDHVGVTGGLLRCPLVVYETQDGAILLEHLPASVPLDVGVKIKSVAVYHYWDYSPRITLASDKTVVQAFSTSYLDDKTAIVVNTGSGVKVLMIKQDDLTMLEYELDV